MPTDPVVCPVHGDELTQYGDTWVCMGPGAPGSCTPPEPDAFDLGLEGWV